MPPAELPILRHLANIRELLASELDVPPYKVIGPDVLFATSTDGRRFSPPRRLHTAPGSIPDQARLAVDAAGRAVIVWEDSTAVRRRVVMRTTRDGGRTLSPPQSLSPAIKAFAPAVVSTPGGFIIVWHEEQFPSIKTVVQTLTLGEGAR